MCGFGWFGFCLFWWGVIVGLVCYFLTQVHYQHYWQKPSNACSVLKFITQFYGKNNILVLQTDKQCSTILQLYSSTLKSLQRSGIVHLLFSYYQKFQAAGPNPGMNMNAPGVHMDTTTSCALRKAIQKYADIHT